MWTVRTNWAVMQQWLCWWSFQVSWTCQWLYRVANLKLAESGGQSHPCMERESRPGRQMTDPHLGAAHFHADWRTLCQRSIQRSGPGPSAELYCVDEERVCISLCVTERGRTRFFLLLPNQANTPYWGYSGVIIDADLLILMTSLVLCYNCVELDRRSVVNQAENQIWVAEDVVNCIFNLLCAHHPLLQSLM